MKFFAVPFILLFSCTLSAQTFHYDYSTLTREVHSYAEGKFNSNAPKLDGPKVGTTSVTSQVSDILNGGDDNYFSTAKSSTALNVGTKYIQARVDLDIIAENKSPNVTIFNEAQGTSDISINCYMTGEDDAVFKFEGILILDADDETSDGFETAFYIGPYNAVTATYDADDDEWDLSGAYTNAAGTVVTVSESIDASTLKTRTYNCHAPANENEQLNLNVNVNTAAAGAWLGQGLSTIHTGVKKTYPTDCQAVIRFLSFQ